MVALFIDRHDLWLLFALPIGYLLALITTVETLAVASTTFLLNNRLATDVTGGLLRGLNHSFVSNRYPTVFAKGKGPEQFLADSLSFEADATAILLLPYCGILQTER